MNDTRFYIALSLADQSGKVKVKDCHSAVHAWFSVNISGVNS